MPRRIASFGMLVMLMATLLWGGCLSCAQFFMFTRLSEKACCMAPGKCKHTPSKPPSTEECRIQPIALKDAPSMAKPASSLVVSPALPPIQASSLTSALRPGARTWTDGSHRGSHRDLRLLYSVFRI